MYRPNFCAQCGTKVLHLRWRWWTSRKFCPACARRFRKPRIITRLITGIALVVSGYVIGRTRRPSPPPLLIERRADSPLSDVAGVPKTTTNSSDDASRSPGSAAAPTVEEDVYLCGARTKKGTPCSRRVQAPARCWQHKGMPAMLPQEKLLIKD